MPKLLRIELTQNQAQELASARDHHHLAYVRERAAAILKIAGGQSVLQVAQQGLLKPRNTDTIYTWIHRYQAKGLPGLLVKSGRGRKPAFFPSVSDGRSSH